MIYYLEAKRTCQTLRHILLSSFAILSPSAIAPADYDGIDINIPLNVGVGLPGQMRFCLDITINNDLLAEGNEDFFVNLASLNPLVVINPQFSSAVVEIVDDDSKLGVATQEYSLLLHG